MGRRGKREFVQVLRLMENFRKEEGVRVRARCPQARRHKPSTPSSTWCCAGWRVDLRDSIWSCTPSCPGSL